LTATERSATSTTTRISAPSDRSTGATGRSEKSASRYAACWLPWLSMVWEKYPCRYSRPTPTKGKRMSLAALQWSPARMPNPPE